MYSLSSFFSKPAQDSNSSPSCSLSPQGKTQKITLGTETALVAISVIVGILILTHGLGIKDISQIGTLGNGAAILCLAVPSGMLVFDILIASIIKAVKKHNALKQTPPLGQNVPTGDTSPANIPSSENKEPSLPPQQPPIQSDQHPSDEDKDIQQPGAPPSDTDNKEPPLPPQQQATDQNEVKIPQPNKKEELIASKKEIEKQQTVLTQRIQSDKEMVEIYDQAIASKKEKLNSINQGNGVHTIHCSEKDIQEFKEHLIAECNRVITQTEQWRETVQQRIKEDETQLQTLIKEHETLTNQIKELDPL